MEKSENRTFKLSSFKVGILLALISFAGVAISFYASKAIENHETDDIAEQFRNLASDRESAIIQEIGYKLNILDIVEFFITSSNSVEPKEFESYARNLLYYGSGIKALGFVEPARLSKLEKTRLNVDSQESYRLKFYSSSHGFEGRLKEELFFNRGFIEALDEARDNAIIAVLFNNKREDLLLFIKPIYGTSKPISKIVDLRKNLRGFVVGYFLFSEIVENAIKRIHDPGGIDIKVYFYSTPKNKKLIYFHPSRLTKLNNPAKPELSNGQSDLVNSTQFNIGEQIWSITTAAIPDFVASRRSNRSLAVLIGSVSFSLAFAALLFALIYTGKTTDG